MFMAGGGAAKGGHTLKYLTTLPALVLQIWSRDTTGTSPNLFGNGALKM
jgi:hypothetical protein